MPKIALLRFWYEGNSFSPLPAREADFRAREWCCGEEAAEFYRGSALEPGGALELCEAHDDLRLVFLDCLAAYPAGPVEAGLFPAFQARVLAHLAEQSWDGVYASLHGAAVCEDIEQPELTLLRALRGAIGDTPLAVSFDLHANLNPEIARLADIVVGYKTYPHLDMAETGRKALKLLRRRIVGEIQPRSLILPADFVPTSFNMRTDRGPMAEMAAIAAEAAEREGLYDISVCGGFACADSPDCGASISLCGEAEEARLAGIAGELRAAYRERAEAFEVRLPDPASVLGRLYPSKDDEGPTAILEPSDNVFSGGAGDTPGLLRALIEMPPDVPCVFAFFWDPELVKRAAAAGQGARIACRLGARLSRAFGEPVNLEAEVERLVHGKFRNLGPMEQGMEVDPGDSLILRRDGLRILVTSRNVPVNDPAYFDHFGIALEPGTLFCVKAKNHFRAAFSSLFKEFLPVETPGPAPSDLLSLPYRKVPPARLLYGRQAARSGQAMEPALRPASCADAEGIARLHAASWRSTYRGIMSDRYLDKEADISLLAEWRALLARQDPGDLVLVAEQEGAILGFIALNESDADYDAMIENLHVAEEVRGSGLGKTLMAAACDALMEAGKKSVCLWVFDRNPAAFSFYLRLGGTPDKHTSDPGAPPSEADTRIGWRDLQALKEACQPGGG